jgi:hypothetical protein
LDVLLVMSHAPPGSRHPVVVASIDAPTPEWFTLPGGRLSHALNIHLAGYEFEGGPAAIS